MEETVKFNLETYVNLYRGEHWSSELVERNIITPIIGGRYYFNQPVEFKYKELSIMFSQGDHPYYFELDNSLMGLVLQLSNVDTTK